MRRAHDEVMRWVVLAVLLAAGRVPAFSLRIPSRLPLRPVAKC